jgi:aspartate racemase
MKTIGLIGGTSWVSTVDYYRIVNELVGERLGGLNSAKILMYSMNFAEKKVHLDANNWARISEEYCKIAKNLETAGAHCIVLCANTPHTIADDIKASVKIPFIHIAEETAKEIAKQKMSKVGLLGTKFTMEGKFFKDKLSNHGIETLIPNEEDRNFIHQSIFAELGKGIFTAETKARYISIINKLIENGAEGIISGCTEIPLLVKQEDCAVPIFDTTMIHATEAVDFALKDVQILN